VPREGSTHFFAKKQFVSVFVVPSSSKFQILHHARLLKQELRSSSTCIMFGWSNELVRPPFFDGVVGVSIILADASVAL
jgi:hypothetical protein